MTVYSKHLPAIAAAATVLIGWAVSPLPAAAQNGPKAVVHVVEYKAGPAWDSAKPPKEQNLQGHFGLVAEKFANGELLANGPTLDDFHGVYIFNVADPAKVRKIVANDQGVKDRVLSEVTIEKWQLFMENLGADVGQDMLFVLKYRPGPSWQPGKPLFEQNVGQHLKYAGGLLQKGDLLAGGPVSAKEGRYIVAAPNVGAAYKLVGNDPAVTDGIFLVQVKPWAPVNRRGLGQVNAQ